MSEQNTCDLCGAEFDYRGPFILGVEGWIVCADCHIDHDPYWIGSSAGVDPDGDHLVGPSPYPDMDVEDQ